MNDQAPNARSAPQRIYEAICDTIGTRAPVRIQRSAEAADLRAKVLAKHRSVVVTTACAERYLSTELFDDL